MLQDFGVQLYVYRDHNQNPCYRGEFRSYRPATLTQNFSQPVTWAPMALTGEKVSFKADLLLTKPALTVPAANWVKTLTRPTTCLEPSKTLELAFEAIDRDRRYEA